MGPAGTSAAVDGAALADAARAGAGFADEQRTLAPDVADGLRDSGLLRMLVPASLGGGEVAPERMVADVEALARADGAAGWCLAVAATGGVLAAFMEPGPRARCSATPAAGWRGCSPPRAAPCPPPTATSP